MDTSVNYYGVLGVPSDADRTEIKTAWSELVQKHHPDMDGGDAAKFMAVQKAFEVLSNDDKRKIYDDARAVTIPLPQDNDPYTPGWGEKVDPHRAAARPAKPQDAPRKRTYVPPHMRTQAPQPAEPAAPQAKPEAPKVQHPAPLASWRMAVKEAVKLKVTRSPWIMWAVPTGIMALAAILGSVAVATAEEGVLAKVIAVMLPVCAIAAAVGGLIDWMKLQGGRKTSAGAALGVIAGVALTIAGLVGGLGALVLSGACVATAALWLNQSLIYKYVTTRHIPARELKKFVAFGKPGRHATDATQRIIESETAELLGDLFRIKSLRLFHDMCVPANRQDRRAENLFHTKYGAAVFPNGHVDHAVTAGKKVALVNSVLWPAGQYDMDAYGNIRLNGQHHSVNLEPFEADLSRWKEKLGRGAETRMFIAVHSDGPVTFNFPDVQVEVVHIDKVVDSIGSWLVPDQEHLDRELNAVVAEHLAAV